MSAPNRLLRPQPNVVKRPAAVVHRLRSSKSSGPALSTYGAKSLAIVQDATPKTFPDVWFTPTFPRCELPAPPGPGPGPGPEAHKPDERKVKLGKTLRVLQERLPALLQSPLPQEILSPSISLHLFPSTHPHLPTVSGRISYMAALWTSPIAWNRVPIVGNVKLEILSERMVNQPLHFSPKRPGAQGEQLIVKWRSTGEAKIWDTILKKLSGGKPLVRSDSQQTDGGQTFTGLFIFEFDHEGRILSHTIEHVEQDGQWENGVGAKVVGLTDWLLGGIKGREGSGGALPAFMLPGNHKGR